ncbi:MAG: chorismate synthase [Lachnospiraceae bacterium]|nr:chorismate synthase [Lachnospiraceae bacterium]
MAGSTFGKNFRVTTWGESHGPALGAVIDGCPAGLPLTSEDIQNYLDRRKPGTSSLTTSRSESDTVEILSGVYEGVTTGCPISLMIRNTSQHSKDYGNLRTTFRPGHADLCFEEKYGIRDHRGGGRSSGRETAARVAAGAIAAKALKTLGIEIHAVTASIGNVTVPAELLDNLDNASLKTAYSLHSVMPDKALDDAATELITRCREAKDSVGGSVYCTVIGMPIGIGEPVFDKLDATLSHAVFSIGAVKAVEIGDGISVSQMNGSKNNDRMRSTPDKKVYYETNHAGGILGGMSSSAPIKIMAYFKPTPSIYRAQETVTKNENGTFENTELTIEGRHDPVIVPRAVVVVECMTAITVLDALLSNMGARMDHLKKIYLD